MFYSAIDFILLFATSFPIIPKLQEEYKIGHSGALAESIRP